MAEDWKAFPYPDPAYVHTPASLEKRWARLHRGDAEPFPADAAAVDAWIAFHAGRFREAVDKGLAAGGSGLVAANKAQLVHASCLEDDTKAKAALLEEVARRCEAQQRAEPTSANAFYLHAAALGRWAQQVPVAEALARGVGGRIKESLARALSLAPQHADAHIGLGAWHAEIIDKAGAMLASLTFGASKTEGLRRLARAIELNPDSAIARIERANALALFEGRQASARAAEQLYREAAACTPLDASERLDVELAKAKLGG